ncbi:MULTISPECIES: hypothetical protein [Flavobacterium]|uniref:Uncharacterized protein n=1 Tax=Flavobacterium keumense TaxID=1306518 RepID=A0ABY8N5P4_9FLAO|nr:MULTISPECIES: hypothetical protein [Flavobacterium]WGK94958.1 hypothetical protein MG292_01665 [Flavobacterium keumense]
MRKGCITIITILFFLPLFSQTHEIVKHNGERIGVNYNKLQQDVISFYFPNSLEENKISKYAVNSVIDTKTGVSQIVSSKIDIKDKKDFRDVVFLKESQVMGLTKGETITVFLGRIKGLSEHDLTAMKKRRLQEKAAQKSSPFVVILSESYDEIKAVLYRY